MKAKCAGCGKRTDVDEALVEPGQEARHAHCLPEEREVSEDELDAMRARGGDIKARRRLAGRRAAATRKRRAAEGKYAVRDTTNSGDDVA